MKKNKVNHAALKCMNVNCEGGDLIWLRSGESRQTSHGLYRVLIAGWHCPNCLESYGSHPFPWILKEIMQKKIELMEYLEARRKTIEASIAAEKLAGNINKEVRERCALAEITALEIWATNGSRDSRHVGIMPSLSDHFEQAECILDHLKTTMQLAPVSYGSQEQSAALWESIRDAHMHAEKALQLWKETSNQHAARE